MARTLLFAEEDVVLHNEFKKVLSESEYGILAAATSEEALIQLKNNKVNLVLCSMKMLMPDGSHFLYKVKAEYPNVIRVVLCNPAELKAALKIIQENTAEFHILKPWENQGLNKLIDKIIKSKELLNNNELHNLMECITELPTIRASYQNILRLVENDSDIREITQAIEQDQSITTKILHVANSAYYGVKTGSVKQAVTYLGLSNIKNLITSTSIIDCFEAKGIFESEVELLFKHSFLCNKMMHLIYDRLMHKKIPETSTTAGLLHNIGIVFLLNYFPHRFVLPYKDNTDIINSVLDYESNVYGAMHTLVGGYLLKKWELPMAIVEAALYHHQPDDERVIDKEMTNVVHIAQYFSWLALGKAPACGFDPKTFEFLGFSHEQLLKVIAESEIIHHWN